MKFFASLFTYYLGSRNSQRNLQLLLRFFLGLTALVVLYSILFHIIMEQEGQKHSWLTGFYWTLTVMSTLGFGDITFEGDVGRVFSMVVLLSGMIALLVVMPFTFAGSAEQLKTYDELFCIYHVMGSPVVIIGGGRVGRATLERNVSTLHRAGADFVMSYASMGASVIFNLLERSDLLMLAEGLNVFRVKVPESLAGKSLVETPIRKETGCSVIAVNDSSGLRINPDPNIELERDAELILIGTVEAERAFLKKFGA